MEKMNIKVDELLDGTMTGGVEVGDVASFERARCTVNLLGETVSVFAKITDCDSGKYCGGVVEFETGGCYGAITSRRDCFGEKTDKLEVNGVPNTPAVREICEHGDEFVYDIIKAVEEASLANPAGRWDVYDSWREFDGFIEWFIDNLTCENGTYECNATINSNEPTFHARIDQHGNLTVSYGGEEIPVEYSLAAQDLEDTIYKEAEKLGNAE